MKKFLKKVTILSLVSLLALNAFLVAPISPAEAASVNLINGSSFEGDVNEHWGFWQDTSNTREYDYYRAYDAPFGNGSYSAAIDAKGNPADAFTAILSSKAANNSFSVDLSKKYYLLFYARATKETELISYLQRADNYSAISPYNAKTIGSTWQRYMISVAPSQSGKALLAFVLGNMPEDSTLYLDSVQLVEANNVLTTKIIAGYIGDSNKNLAISNISYFSENEISIELPYYNPDGSGEGTIKIHPSTVSASNISFRMPERTYSGIGRVYLNDLFAGQFNYSVLPRITEFHPSVIRLDQDVIVYGSGFSPKENTSFLISEKINQSGARESVWIKPESFDSNLTQMRFKMPAGTVNGRIYVQTSSINTEGVEVINKSNQLVYKLKPVISATNWSARGYEHVGDKLRIYGLGFGRMPVVNYYNDAGVLVDSLRANFISATELETIEVATTKKTNSFNIAIVSDGIMSDRSDALSYLAKPLLTDIKSSKSRTMAESGLMIPAAKVGETITINGVSLKSDSGAMSVEFQGNGRRIEVPVAEPSKLTGNSVSVVVPDASVSGYIGVKVNGAYSNYLPIEIIPTIVSISPDPVVPGQEIIISANGVGDNLNLARIEFNTGKEGSVIMSPASITMRDNVAEIKLITPYNIANNGASVNLQYDRWRDDGKETLSIRPNIVRAGINMDTKILSIVGYGFSISPNENKLSFEYADENQTVVSPKYRMLGVYPSDEGQEIRVQIQDDYHYGHVRVSVGSYESNEVSFGPISIAKISRRVEYVKNSNAMMGVLYISGYNFGSGGGVRVGERWAEVHYRSDFFIIAVVPEENLYDGPVIVARE
jgi:hypothetical protein